MSELFSFLCNLNENWPITNCMFLFIHVYSPSFSCVYYGISCVNRSFSKDAENSTQNSIVMSLPVYISFSFFIIYGLLKASIQ